MRKQFFQSPAEKYERRAEYPEDIYREIHRPCGETAETFVVAGGVHFRKHFSKEQQEKCGQYHRYQYSYYVVVDDHVVAQQVFEYQDDAYVYEVVGYKYRGQKSFRAGKEAGYAPFRRIGGVFETFYLGFGE